MPRSAEEQGQVLREFRVATWMTTGDVGEALGGFKAQTVTAWEMGRNKPSREVLVRLAVLWDAPLQLLLHELGDPVALPVVDGQPYTFGRWHDAVRARRQAALDRNTFTHRNGTRRAGKKAMSGQTGEDGGIPYMYSGTSERRARVSA